MLDFACFVPKMIIFNYSMIINYYPWQNTTGNKFCHEITYNFFQINEIFFILIKKENYIQSF